MKSDHRYKNLKKKCSKSTNISLSERATSNLRDPSFKTKAIIMSVQKELLDIKNEIIKDEILNSNKSNLISKPLISKRIKVY